MKTHPLFFVGSLPHPNPREAIDFVKKYSTHLPFLPQLPEANPQEDMIGQVLRGIDLGFWDETASSCLELFQNEFVDSPRFKIEIAGPYTVAKSMSGKFVEIAPLWARFWKGLRKQLSEASFCGELWLQIDEPYWDRNNELPDGYTAFLQVVKEVGGYCKLGIHSCASLRPSVFIDHLKLLDFFSFDFDSDNLEIKEMEDWQRRLELGKVLVYGGKNPRDAIVGSPLAKSKNLWLSAPCGYYGRNIQDLEGELGDWLK